MTTKIKTRKTSAERRAETAANTTPRPNQKVPGGGYGTTFDLKEWEGTSRHTCGFWPFVNGSPAPIHGAQIGRHYYTGEPVGFDPLSWFDRKMMMNPSAFIISNPAVGKSSLIRKMEIGAVATGTNVLVLGDRKDEHSQLIELMGGQIIHLGPGRGKLNVLDPGDVSEAIQQIMEQCEDKRRAEKITAKLIESMHERRTANVVGLVAIYRGTQPRGVEGSLIDASLRWLHDNEEATPILTDLIRVLRDGPEDVRAVANVEGDDPEYRKVTRDLLNDLVGLTAKGGLGGMFNGQSTAHVRRDVSVCFDVNGIDENNKEALAAAYIACWAAGFGMIDVAHAMTDAGLEPTRRYLAVLDEFWQPLSASPGMVRRVNALTRLNRDKGVAVVYATHSLTDLLAVGSESDRDMAREIVSRCGALVIGGLSRSELEERVTKVIRLHQSEIDLILSWNAPASMTDDGIVQDMIGRGKFLIKRSEEPGIPVAVVFTQHEIDLDIHDTNKRIRKDGTNA